MTSQSCTDPNNIVARVGCDWLRQDHHQKMRQLYGSIDAFFGRWRLVETKNPSPDPLRRSLPNAKEDIARSLLPFVYCTETEGVSSPPVIGLKALTIVAPPKPTYTC